MSEHNACEYEATCAAESAVAIIRWAMNIAIGLVVGVLGTLVAFWYRA